jgi:hypothetical protein
MTGKEWRVDSIRTGDNRRDVARATEITKYFFHAVHFLSQQQTHNCTPLTLL